LYALKEEGVGLKDRNNSLTRCRKQNLMQFHSFCKSHFSGSKPSSKHSELKEMGEKKNGTKVIIENLHSIFIFYNANRKY
jgi:hypothetical protein